MMYSWLMDGQMCRLMLKNVFGEKGNMLETQIYTKARRQGLIANRALQTTGHGRANPAQSLVHDWVGVGDHSDETGSHQVLTHF